MPHSQTVQFDKHEALQQVLWDLYKDVHGIRPRFINFDQMSLEELEAMYDDLVIQLNAANEANAHAQLEAIKRFEELVTDTIKDGAGDRQTAIEWLRDAENDAQMKFDDDYFCWEYGLPYQYLKQETTA